MNQVLQNQTITHFSTSSRFELLSRDYYLFRTNIKTNHILSPQIIDLDFTLITILNARSPKVTKLIVQVFQMRKGKLLLNIKEIEKSAKRTKL